MLIHNATLLTLLGGCAIAVQNAVMVAMTGRGLGLTAALLVNSTVGITLLAVIEYARLGPSFADEIIRRVEWWFLLPGLLGTLYVFASLYGYRHQGAATTIALIVAAQLIAGLALDAFGFRGETVPVTPERLIGVVLLLAGAALVMRRV
jgi:transporter family-2 protein